MPFVQRTSPRASRYDYTSGGAYFVTVCTKDRVHYFGQVRDGTMILNQVGKICDEELHRMIRKRDMVDLHGYVIMPNHVHLLLVVDDDRRDTGLPCPDTINHSKKDDASVRPYNNPSSISHQSLWSIIGWRKSATTKSCHEWWYAFARQSRYHDHIVRNEQEYERIKWYIQNNPKNWEHDSLQ